jgi:hypothetical protein
MAGTTASNPLATSFNMNGGTATGGNGGNDPVMFITTDGNYSSQGTSLARAAAVAGLPLTEGFTAVKNTTTTLSGITGSVGGLSDYKGILFWQDRRNSNVLLNPDDGSSIPGSRNATTTDTSPQFELISGNANMQMNGLIYQPRGSWFYLQSGNGGGSAILRLTMVTGALTCGTTGCGSASVVLKGPTAPTVIYTTALIQ